MVYGRWLLLLGWFACTACTESVEVLSVYDAGGQSAFVPGPVPQRSPDASKPMVAEPDSCGGCQPSQLCASDGCRERVGITRHTSHFTHGCYVADGRLFCFGRNSAGQLGLDDLMQRAVPTRVGGDNDWIEVGHGEEHSCGIRAPGLLYCWGQNSVGQLGLGDTRQRLVPTRVGADDDWAALACGGNNCCALKAVGEAQCWGDNLEGKPAQNDGFQASDVLSPSPVDGDFRFRTVALGQGHGQAITMTGQLLGWGRNPMGEAGIGPGIQQWRTPLPVGEESDWVSVSASQHHSCGVRADGSLWCWGSNGHGELGIGPILDDGQVVFSPSPVGSALDWASVQVGWFHSCALKRDGRLLCFGRAIEGQLGNGGGDPVGEPLEVQGGGVFRQLAVGSMHTCAVDGQDRMNCWGANQYGQLGMGDTERRYVPTPQP